MRQIGIGHRNPGVEKLWRPERPVPIAEQNRNAAGGPADDREVQKPVAIEIVDGDGRRIDDRGKVQGRLESAIPITHMYRDTAAGSGNKILNPVAVELAHRKGR